MCERERETETEKQKDRKRVHYNPKNTMESNLALSSEATDTRGRNMAVVFCSSSHQEVKSIFPPCEFEVDL